MLSLGAIFQLNVHQNAFAAGASPRTPQGKFTALPRQWSTLTGFQGTASRHGRGEEEREGEEKRGKGRGPFPTSCLH